MQFLTCTSAHGRSLSDFPGRHGSIQFFVRRRQQNAFRLLPTRRHSLSRLLLGPRFFSRLRFESAAICRRGDCRRCGHSDGSGQSRRCRFCCGSVNWRDCDVAIHSDVVSFLRSINAHARPWNGKMKIEVEKLCCECHPFNAMDVN